MCFYGCQDLSWHKHKRRKSLLQIYFPKMCYNTALPLVTLGVTNYLKDGWGFHFLVCNSYWTPMVPEVLKFYESA